MERVALLKQKGLTGQMVVAEFLRQSMPPLQEHSRPMWTLTSSPDDNWLSSCGLNAVAVDAATRTLFGARGVWKPAGEVHLLYKRTQGLRDQIRQGMPTFNARGLMGVVLPQEEAEADATAGDDGAEEETSQAGTAREVVILDGDDDGRVPSPGQIGRASCRERVYVLV